MTAGTVASPAACDLQRPQTRGEARLRGEPTGPHQSIDPHEAIDLHESTGPHEAIDLHQSTGPHEAIDLHESTGPHEAIDLHESTGPHEAIDLHESTGPHEAADLHESTGPQRAADLHQSTGPHEAADLHQSTDHGRAGHGSPDAPQRGRPAHTDEGDTSPTHYGPLPPRTVPAGADVSLGLLGWLAVLLVVGLLTVLAHAASMRSVHAEHREPPLHTDSAQVLAP